MEQTVDNTKLLAAYRIINVQLAKGTQKLKSDIQLQEERYILASEMLLKERQENKALRDMVRKLKDQLQMITKVMISVQDQSEHVFNMINRRHDQALDFQHNYTPRAQQVFDRRRTENPPYVDEMAIPEEECLAAENADGDDAVMEETGERTSETVCEANQLPEMELDESYSLRKERRSGGSGTLATSSPLVQRLKRRSKNLSFDESFETIDRERVFKLSRQSDERRQIYAGLSRRSSVARVIDSLDEFHATDPRSNDISDMDISELIQDTLRSSVRIETDPNLSNSFSEENSKSDPLRPVSAPSVPDACQGVPKIAVSESMHSTNSRMMLDDECSESKSGDECAEEEMTVFNPSELAASCSTPVVKGSDGLSSADSRDRPRGPSRGPSRGTLPKAKSETELHLPMQPVVVLRPLTESVLKMHNIITQKKRRGRPPKNRDIQIAEKERHCISSDEGTLETNGSTLEPYSSLENLSVQSYDQGRPRRRAAPKTLKEPNLTLKLRRH